MSKENNVQMNEETKDNLETTIPSMDEFKEELENSFQKISEGDIIKGTVIGVSDTEVTVDLRYYAEGIIKLDELSNDPRFSIKSDINIGDEISAEVLREDDGMGNLLLSKKRADNVLAWDALKDALNTKKKYTVKVASEVNKGVITYLEGIRGFIPASALSLRYVEDLSSYVGQTLEVIVITADEDKNRLVLSAKEVEKEKELADRNSKISKLQRGLVTTGTVEKIVPYGTFINIGDGLSGLVHISQICGRRIQSPKEVLKEGQEVKVKIIDIKDSKISLSIKAATKEEDITKDPTSAPMEYTSGEEASTGLAHLLENIKL